MTRLGSKNLRMRAVLWSQASYDDAGNVTVNAAVEIKCQWEKKTMESIDANGKPVAIESRVLVDREIVIGSILRLGELEDLPEPPDTVDQLRQVVHYEEVPDTKGRNPTRVVLLKRYGESLPTLV